MPEKFPILAEVKMELKEGDVSQSEHVTQLSGGPMHASALKGTEHPHFGTLAIKQNVCDWPVQV